MPGAPDSKPGFGMVFFGLLLGAALGVVGDRLVLDGQLSERGIEVQSPSSSAPSLALEDKEVVEVTKRWVSYFELTSVTPTQLQKRMADSNEKTPVAGQLSEALILSAYILDLKRQSQNDSREQFISIYQQYFAAIKQGPFLRAHTTLSATKADGAVAKTAVITPTVTSKAETTKQDTLSVQESKTSERKPDTSKAESEKAPAAPQTNKKDEQSKSDQKTVADVKKPATEPAKSAPTQKKSRTSYRRLLRLGERALENGKLSDAKKALTEAAAIKPKAHKPRVLLGYLELNRGNLGQALRAFRAANRLKPRDRQTLLGLGSVYAKQGKKEEARKIYERYQSYFKGASDRRTIENRLEKLGK